jgi:long-chain acyl-CoA synthetase
MTNLVEDIGDTVQTQPDRLAVAYDGHEFTYRELWGMIGQFSAAVQDAGVGPGDRVALYLPNLPQFVVAFLGTVHAGGIVVPMNPQYKSREIEHLLTDSEASVVVALSDLAPFVAEVRDATSVDTVVTVGDEPDVDDTVDFRAFLADEPADVVARDDDDVAVQPYTSGTTGQPKGVLLTHRNIASNARATASVMSGGVQADDRFLGVLPLFHIYGMTVTMIATLFGGASYHPYPKWDVDAVRQLIESQDLTVMHGVPAMFNDMVSVDDPDAYDLSSLRFVNSGGSSLPIDVLERFEELYGIELYEGYGLTETSPVTHFNMPGNRRPGSIGKPLEGVQSMIVDEDFEPVAPIDGVGPVDESEVDLDAITGEIVVSGPNVMQGYFNRPEANEAAFTERDGTRWFHTGDVGYVDADGFYYVVDREKHVIVTGGYNVYPRELEELLFEHPAIADAAVVGVPDERRGETVHAYVVPAPDAEVTPDEVKQYCLDNLAEYKHPREVHFVDELPRTASGKVKKFELAEA